MLYDFIITLLLDNVRANFTIEDQGIRLEFRGTKRFLGSSLKPIETVRAVQTEQSNSTALVDGNYVVKIYPGPSYHMNGRVDLKFYISYYIPV